MPIQILPPQLANQIAAGEVVERPASVVKELVENSLDAGATKIQIDIENGGATLIRIRDNGLGIPKDELPLSLARHATSKISSIDDLEAILSFGFRGEALASISSVSRLTLTSRTAEQNEAWQVFVQGRDQESTIKPASHPVGTTVEVANLFFNTPARRKFLRTDKTEFAHIDEVIRRIALAKNHIAFTLTHNGKIIRQYKSAVENNQILKRVASICGDDFVQNALHIDWKHDDLHLFGWVATPNFTRSQNDLSYCYINGRMVKDKVITHAIRQAYAEHLQAEQYPAFVLFLDLNPNDVDVNVHPTKHEVRFHQARLIHDFIYQGISNALLNVDQLDFSHSELETATQIEEPQAGYSSYQAETKPNRVAAGENIFQGYSHSSKQGNFTPRFSNTYGNKYNNYSSEKVSKTESRLYGELLKSEPIETVETIETAETIQTKETEMPSNQFNQATPSSTMLHALALVENKALLLQQNADFYLLPIDLLQQQRMKLLLSSKNSPKQPLLIPVVFRLTEEQLTHWQAQKSHFAELGFEFVENLVQHRITLNSLPQCLRQQNLQKMVVSLLNHQHSEIKHSEINEFLTALLATVEWQNIDVFASAVNMLQEMENLTTPQALSAMLIKVDFSHYLNVSK